MTGQRVMAVLNSSSESLPEKSAYTKKAVIKPFEG